MSIHSLHSQINTIEQQRVFEKVSSQCRLLSIYSIKTLIPMTNFDKSIEYQDEKIISGENIITNN